MFKLRANICNMLMMEDIQCGFMIFLKDKLLSLIIGEGEKKNKMYFPHL